MKKFFLSWIAAISILCAYTQNVGIGTSAPVSKLQINNNGGFRPALTLFDSTANSGYPVVHFQNAGGSGFWQIGGNLYDGSPTGSYFDIYNSKAAAYFLTVRGDGNVGIGNSLPQSRLDVGGDLNFTGALKIAGNPGTLGQVLSSTGIGTPAWQTAALSNTTRFSASMPSVAGSSVNMNFTTTYNTNSADVAILPNSITINHTGLYHFEGFVQSSFDFSSPSTFAPRCAVTMNIGLTSYPLIYGALTTQTTSVQFLKADRFVFDIYITSGTTLSISAAYSSGSASTGTGGWFTGYLISD